jgi:hypothetical protein
MEPILWLLNLQLQRRRRSRPEFFTSQKKIFLFSRLTRLVGLAPGFVLTTFNIGFPTYLTYENKPLKFLPLKYAKLEIPVVKYSDGRCRYSGALDTTFQKKTFEARIYSRKVGQEKCQTKRYLI